MFYKKFFSISEFAKINGVTRQTLIYYDKIGLFSPAFVGENKYRAYTHGQLGTISTITMLTDLGVPLKTIKNLLSEISPKTTTDILNYQLNTIEEKISRFSTLKTMIQLRLEQIESGKIGYEHCEEFSVVNIDCPIALYQGEEINCEQKEISDDMMLNFFSVVEKTGIPMIFSLAYLKDTHSILKEGNDKVVRMCFRVNEEKFANTFLPSGKYVVGYGKGDYGNNAATYAKLRNFAESEGFAPIGEIFEEYVIDELAEKNPNNFVYKIMLRVN